MAKSQLRSNREKKKPKQAKKAPAPASAFGVSPGRMLPPVPAKKR